MRAMTTSPAPIEVPPSTVGSRLQRAIESAPDVTVQSLADELGYHRAQVGRAGYTTKGTLRSA